MNEPPAAEPPAVETPAVETPSEKAPPEKAPDPVVAAYAARMRRQRWRYAFLVAAVAVVVALGAVVAWTQGEITHVRHTTASQTPPAIGVAAPTAQQTVAWHSGDAGAVGAPVSGGVVVTHDTHTVRGRNAMTGAVVWSYERSDRTVCAAIQLSGVTIALYSVHGNCDEATGLDSQTGARNWTRTINEDGASIDGTPTIQTSTFSFLLGTSSVLYAIDPISGINRWIYQPKNCAINSWAIGSNGVLINQTCAGKRCDGLKFCVNGPQLLMRSATNGRSDKPGEANPDQITWLLPHITDVAVCADEVTATYRASTRELVRYSPATGQVTSRFALSPAPASATVRQAVATTTGELVHIGDRLMFVPVSSTQPAWTIAVAGQFRVTTRNGESPADLSTAILTVTGAAGAPGVAELEPNTGLIGTRFAIGNAQVSAVPLGTGFVLTGASTTVTR